MAVAVGVLVGWAEYLDLSSTQLLEALRKPALSFKDPKAGAGERGAKKGNCQLRDCIAAQPVSKRGLASLHRLCARIAPGSFWRPIKS